MSSALSDWAAKTSPADGTGAEPDDSKRLAKYQNFMEASNLAAALGRTHAERKATRKAKMLLTRHPGMDVSGLDLNEFDDWQDFGVGKEHGARGVLKRFAKKRFADADDPGRAMNRWNMNLSKAMEGQMVEGVQNELDPTLQSMQERASQFAETDAISAEQEATARSRIASQFRQQESTRLNRVAAAMGMGNMAASPAAAALASRAADDVDRAMVSTLADFGLKVSEVNRQQARQDMDLATRITMARSNLLNPDAQSLIGLRSEVASIRDALYSRGVTMDLMEQQIDDANEDGGWLDYAGGFAGLLTGAGAAAQGFSALSSLGDVE